MVSRSFTLYAHRGAPSELPENTIASFQLALEIGVDAIETDAHMTRDGVIVLSHDPRGIRMAGVDERIRERRFDEIQQWDAGFGFLDEQGRRALLGKGYRIPSFEQALLEFPKVKFNVDAKQVGEEMCAGIVGLVRKHKAQERVRIASFSMGNLLRVRKMGYEGETGLGQLEVAALVAMPSRVLERIKIGGNAVQIPRHAGPIRLDSEAFVKRCHSKGLRVDYWTINEIEEARELIRLGADGIMTDEPRRLAFLLEETKGT